MAERVHAVSNSSAALSLRRALVSLDTSEQVVVLEDDLGVGPIDNTEPQRWLVDELGYPESSPTIERAWPISSVAPSC